MVVVKSMMCRKFNSCCTEFKVFELLLYFFFPLKHQEQLSVKCNLHVMYALYTQTYIYLFLKD